MIELHEQLYQATKKYLAACDANKPPQTREEFEQACFLTKIYHDEMRRIVQEIEESE